MTSLVTLSVIATETSIGGDDGAASGIVNANGGDGAIGNGFGSDGSDDVATGSDDVFSVKH